MKYNSFINNQNLLSDHSFATNDSSIEINEKSSLSQFMLKSEPIKQQAKINILSRRPSFASIVDSESIRNYFFRILNFSSF